VEELPPPPVDLVPQALMEKPDHSIFCCPGCGSFLDAPRVNPETGELGRKCVACPAWHPLGEAGVGG
jgi:hypothetical protein